MTKNETLNDIMYAISFPAQALILPFQLLRERPFESNATKIVDIAVPKRVLYLEKDLNLPQFQQEVQGFKEVEKLLLRWRYVPAGDAFVHTSKKRIRDCSPERAWSFIQDNVGLDEESKDRKEDDTRIYSTGHFYSTLRDLQGKYWLHVKSPKSFWPCWSEIDLIGRR